MSEEGSRILVVLVSDQPLVHQAVSLQFEKESDIELASVWATVYEGITSLIEQHQPHVVLLDLDALLSFPKIHNFNHGLLRSILHRLGRDLVDVRFVVLASRQQEGLLASARELGVHGYLVKHDDLMLQLASVIRIIFNGGVCYSFQCTQGGDPAAGEGEERGEGDCPFTELPLTDRELDILEAFVADPDGSNRDHAKRLGITENTLNAHLRSIYRKLGVSNRSGAVLKALKLGIISLPHLPDV